MCVSASVGACAYLGECERVRCVFFSSFSDGPEDLPVWQPHPGGGSQDLQGGPTVMIGVLSQGTIRDAVLLLVCSVSSDNLLNLSEPQFPFLYVSGENLLDLVSFSTLVHVLKFL